jgi:hypothetical protein
VSLTQFSFRKAHAWRHGAGNDVLLELAIEMGRPTHDSRQPGTEEDARARPADDSRSNVAKPVDGPTRAESNRPQEWLARAPERW